MKIAAVQHDIVWENPEANFDRLAPRIAAAAAAGANLAVLTEMYATGFSTATDRIAEPEDGPSVRFLLDQAACHGLWVAGSIPTRPTGGGRPVNRLVVAEPGGTTHTYDKVHPFTYAGEHEHYAPGAGPVTIDLLGVRTTLFVCYDLRFADGFWDAAADTDLYLGVANWPASRASHWTTLLRARAIENQAYVVGVNRVGEGAGLVYGGGSRIIDPQGEILAEADDTAITVFADIDPVRVAETRRDFPFHQDRAENKSPED